MVLGSSYLNCIKEKIVNDSKLHMKNMDTENGQYAQ